MRETRYGSELPRLWTKPLRPLTPATTLGFQCCEFATDIVEVVLYPWERFFLIHALEIRPDGSFRYRTILLLVARQNGKTLLFKILALFFMYILGVRLVIGTAQNLDVSEKTWEEVVEDAQASEDLAAEIARIDKTNGKKSLRLLSGSRYKIAAASRRGGRGFTGALVEMDELREHQSWESWSAVTKTTMAVPNAQIYGASNAGDAASIVLRHLRRIALTDLAERGDAAAAAELDEPILKMMEELSETDFDEDLIDDDSLGIFEWSAPPGCAVNDRDGWAAANPSLGHLITERSIAAAMKTDPEWEFRTEVMCQWRSTAGKGPFPEGDWEEGTDPESAIADDSAIAVCVDVSYDRSMSYVAAAGFRTDGNVHVEIIAQRAGTEWVRPWIAAPERPTFQALTYQTNGAPVSSLKDALADAGPPVVDWGGPELGRASGLFYDLVRLPRPGDPDDALKRRLFHLPQPVLDLPATSAVPKAVGDSWSLDRKNSPNDCAPLQATFGAVWLLLRPPEEKKPEPKIRVIGG